MVNETSPRAAERELALSYAPADARAGLHALFALDDTLAAILRTTREPIVGQMRLTWWHDALSKLDGRSPPPANPVLQALAADVVPRVGSGPLTSMIDGWEALLDDPLDAEAMERFARERGGGLFAAAAALLGAGRPGLREAGAGWALADLAEHLSDPERRALARTMGKGWLDDAMASRWPGRLRALGALVLLSREGMPGSPKRVARLLWHRVTGA